MHCMQEPFEPVPQNTTHFHETSSLLQFDMTCYSFEHITAFFGESSAGFSSYRRTNAVSCSRVKDFVVEHDSGGARRKKQTVSALHSKLSNKHDVMISIFDDVYLHRKLSGQTCKDQK